MPSVVQEVMMKEIVKEFEGNPYAFISSFQGLAVSDLSELRRNLEKVSKRSLVIKHSLVKKVLASMAFSNGDSFLKNNVLVTFGDKDPQVISKAIMDYAKANNKVVAEAVVFEKKLYDQSFVKALAQLPSRKELLTQAVVRMKSPISGFVMTLNQLLRGVAVAVNEIKKQKEAVAA